VSDTALAPEGAVTKKSKRPLLVGLVLMIAGGGGGYYAASSGMIPGLGGTERGQEHEAEVGALPEIAFVPIDPVVVSLGPDAGSRHLKFTAQLEVAKPHAEEVAMLMPRILDVLNSYLRAVAMADLEDPAAMMRLRAQMLRRVQIVTGEGRVRDLLVTEFILN
jgi:flagellar FliL protein